MRTDKAKYEGVIEYIRIRMSYYVENMIPEKKLRDNEEIRLYDNISELLSMIDFIGETLPYDLERLILIVKKKHNEEMKRLIKKGKYKII